MFIHFVQTMILDDLRNASSAALLHCNQDAKPFSCCYSHVACLIKLLIPNVNLGDFFLAISVSYVAPLKVERSPALQ